MEVTEISMVRHIPPPPVINFIPNPRQTTHPACTQCGLTFKKQKDLKKHLGDESWKEYVEVKFKDHSKCEECCLFFKTYKAYMQHYGKVHSIKSRNCVCNICNKTFKSKYAVKFHMRQVHEKTTRTKCPLCEKEFYTKYLIPPHMLRCNMRDNNIIV